jgi:hypothetical protein
MMYFPLVFFLIIDTRTANCVSYILGEIQIELGMFRIMQNVQIMFLLPLF